MKKENFLWTSSKTGLLGGAIAIFICLLGMVEIFNKRYVIDELLPLGIFLLLATAFATGFIASRRAQEQFSESQPVYNLITGALGGAIVGILLMVLIIATDQINLRNVFLNASPTLVSILTFGRGLSGVWIMAVIGVAFGFFGGAFLIVPEKYRNPILRSLLWSFLLALFSGLFRVVLINQGSVFEAIAKFLFGTTGLSLFGAILIFASILFISMLSSRGGSSVRQRITQLPKRNQVILRVVVIALIVYIAIGLPQVSGPFIAQVIVILGLYTLMGLGLNITLGFAGLLDLGFVAFYAIGAYTVGLLTSYGQFGLQHISFWLAAPIAVLVAMLFGAFLGLPVLGVRGDYLAIATLGFGEIVRLLAGSDFLSPYFGGPRGIIGIQKPCLGFLESFIKVDTPQVCNGIEFGGPKEIYYIAVISAILIAFIAWRLRESRLGRAWMAIREDEDVAEALGINLIQTKLLAYMLGAAFAGLGGAIFSTLVGSIFSSSMQLIVSINVVALLVVGGMGSIPGVVVGTIALIGLPELLREVSEYRFLLYGIALIGMMLSKPEGLWPSQAVLRELHHEVPIPETGSSLAPEVATPE